MRRACGGGVILAMPTLPGPPPRRDALQEDLHRFEDRTLQLTAFAALAGAPVVREPPPPPPRPSSHHRACACPPRLVNPMCNPAHCLGAVAGILLGSTWSRCCTNLKGWLHLHIPFERRLCGACTHPPAKSSQLFAKLPPKVSRLFCKLHRFTADPSLLHEACHFDSKPSRTWGLDCRGRVGWHSGPDSRLLLG